MKRVLITGSKGFVGSYLAALAVEKGTVVTGFDRTAGLDRTEINQLEGVLEDTKAIEGAVKKAKPDTIFHLAAQSSSLVSWEKPQETFQSNVMGTINVLEAIKKHAPSARLVFVSSSECYGIVDQKQMPITEKQELDPVSPYGVTKKFGEELCQFYAQHYEIDAKIARFFNVVGPKQRDDFVVSNWSKQIAEIEKNKQGLIKVGNVENWRDFLDARDAAQALLMIGKSKTDHEVFNVCSGKPVQLKQVLEMILKMATRDIPYSTDKSKFRKFDIKKYYGSNTRLLKETGWKPKYDLETSIKESLEYWRGKKQ
jgi:GDP-4-dehydro-6-deoxy-D-mannose reductase